MARDPLTVFDNALLLEVVSNLPAEDVLSAHNVSHGWRAFFTRARVYKSLIVSLPNLDPSARHEIKALRPKKRVSDDIRNKCLLAIRSERGWAEGELVVQWAPTTLTQPDQYIATTDPFLGGFLTICLRDSEERDRWSMIISPSDLSAGSSCRLPEADKYTTAHVDFLGLVIYQVTQVGELEGDNPGYEVNVWVSERTRALFPKDENASEDGLGDEEEEGSGQEGNVIPGFERLATFMVSNPSTSEEGFAFALLVEADDDTRTLSVLAVHETNDHDIRIEHLLDSTDNLEPVEDDEIYMLEDKNRDVMSWTGDPPFLLSDDKYVFRFSAALEVYSRLRGGYICICPHRGSEHLAAVYAFTGIAGRLTTRSGVAIDSAATNQPVALRGVIPGERAGGALYQQLARQFEHEQYYIYRSKVGLKITICGTDLVFVFSDGIVQIIKDYATVIEDAGDLPQEERAEHMARNSILLAREFNASPDVTNVTSWGTRFAIAYGDDLMVFDTRDIVLPIDGEPAPQMPVTLIAGTRRSAALISMTQEAIHEVAFLDSSQEAVYKAAAEKDKKMMPWDKGWKKADTYDDPRHYIVKRYTFDVKV